MHSGDRWVGDSERASDVHVSVVFMLAPRYELATCPVSPQRQWIGSSPLHDPVREKRVIESGWIGFNLNPLWRPRLLQTTAVSSWIAGRRGVEQMSKQAAQVGLHDERRAALYSERVSIASHLQPTDRLNPVGTLQAKAVLCSIFASKIGTFKLTIKERGNKNANIHIHAKTFIVFPYSHWYGNCYFPSLCYWRAESLWSVRCVFERKWFWTDASGQPTSPPLTASKRSSSRFSSNRGTATEYRAEGTGTVSHWNTCSLSPYSSLPLSGIITHTRVCAQVSQIA